MITGTVLQPTKVFDSKQGTWLGLYLQKGDIIIADIRDVQWLHLISVNGLPYVGDVWASAGINEQYINWSEDEIVPPPPVVDDYILHYVDGMMVGRYNLQK